MKTVSPLKFWIDEMNAAGRQLEDVEFLYDFAKEDESAAEELDKAYSSLDRTLGSLEMRNMLGEEGDNLGAIIKIKGTGTRRR